MQFTAVTAGKSWKAINSAFFKNSLKIFKSAAGLKVE